MSGTLILRLLLLALPVGFSTVVAEPDSTASAAAARAAAGPAVLAAGQDTLLVHEYRSPSACVNSVRASFRHSRDRGYGIGGGPIFGLHAVDMTPVEELLKRVPPLAGRNFGFNHFSREPFWLKGGMGYLGVGNGLRLGGGGAGGSLRFLASYREQDATVALLDVELGYGGFLVEKASVSGRFNFVTGGIIGGGSTRVKATLVDAQDYSLFERAEDGQESDKITARFFALELHGAATYTICPIFHLGFTLSVPCFVSSNGFEPYTSGFASVNPGLGLRFIFGNLG